MLSASLSTNRLYDLSLAESRRKVKKDGSKIVQKYSKIYGHTSFKQIMEDKQEEKEVVNMRDMRVRKKTGKGLEE